MLDTSAAFIVARGKPEWARSPVTLASIYSGAETPIASLTTAVSMPRRVDALLAESLEPGEVRELEAAE
jgi:hypothetical protein